MPTALLNGNQLWNVLWHEKCLDSQPGYSADYQVVDIEAI